MIWIVKLETAKYKTEVKKNKSIRTLLLKIKFHFNIQYYQHNLYREHITFIKNDKILFTFYCFLLSDLKS